MAGVRKSAKGISASRTIWLLLALLLWVVAILLAWPWIVPSAQAAESYDNCSGYIDSVPAVIATQGTWCLRKDLSTAQTSGNAIEIAANNVVIDCNDFKLGGLAAGPSSQAIGIHAEGRQNVAIRHCNIRGFYEAVYLDSVKGALVEDNRFDGNLAYGIDVEFDPHCLVRRNRVYATGGADGVSVAFGIYATGDIVDNIVDGVSATGTAAFVTGIQAQGKSARISGNRVGGLAQTGDGGKVFGIAAGGGGLDTSIKDTITGNRIVADAPGTDGAGIATSTGSSCYGNTIANFSEGRMLDVCSEANGNDRL